jgi:Mg2+-importing ATPase
LSLLVLVVFAVNVIYHRPVVDSLLFSVALAVGLAPELLPAILGFNLARSAQAMARHGVLVRHLPAIENLGSMDLLCTDKTGTLTEGVVRLDAALGAVGEPCQRVLRLALWNARLQTGLPNPLDPAIIARAPADAPMPPKLAEVPYDFVRRRVSVVVEAPEGPLLVTKGAFDGLLAACDRVAEGEVEVGLDADRAAALRARFAGWSAKGYRVLGVAAKLLPAGSGYGREVECGLVFHGFLLFLDPPKVGVKETVAALAGLGVRLKIVTGDNGLVAAHVAEAVGIEAGAVLSGADLVEMSDEALGRAAETVDLFVEVDPNQKERVVRLLRRGGHVVGYLGDGINDAPALHAADVGVSVEGAVDVAREAADFVLLEPDLDVLRRGILEGRTTFANTLKYVLTTESANLGNMVSMAAASLFLPFFPLLAKQILLNNFLSDVPAMAIASDRVDGELIARPRRWDLKFVRRFMVEFGLLSSCFDLCTFGVLIYGFGASGDRFRTAWFVESLLTELVVALIVRTRRPAWRSRPSAGLVWSTAGVAMLTFALPWLPGASLLGLIPLEAPVLAAIVVITLLYAASAELVKASFYRRAEA